MNGARPVIIVGELLSTAPRLRSAWGEARRLSLLEGWLVTQLDVALRPHCRLTVERRRPGTLVIQVDSAAWAMRVRYALPELQRQLSQLPEAGKLRRLTIKVHPAADLRAAQRPARQVRLPEKAAAALRSMAATIEHPALKAALLRLSRRAG